MIKLNSLYNYLNLKNKNKKILNFLKLQTAAPFLKYKALMQYMPPDMDRDLNARFL